MEIVLTGDDLGETIKELERSGWKMWKVFCLGCWADIFINIADENEHKGFCPRCGWEL